jgi:hypothetical protein
MLYSPFLIKPIQLIFCLWQYKSLGERREGVEMDHMLIRYNPPTPSPASDGINAQHIPQITLPAYLE